MKIAVLEWICGGGMHAIQIDEIPDSLLREGRAMLLCVIEQLAAAGNHVSTVLDSRLNISKVSMPNSAEFVDFSTLTSSSDGNDPIESTISKWKQLAKSCDLSIVIAPEIDAILQRCIQSLIEDGLPLINCAGAFLDNSASKLRTAMRLTELGLPTPPTISAKCFDTTQFGSAQFGSAQFGSATGLWCVKPDLGAGCDGLHIGNAVEILQVVHQIESKAEWIVQPWLDGQAFSCSAIVDSQGHADWLPLVTQRLKSAPLREQTTTRQYCGGQLVSPEKMLPPVDLLNETLSILNVSESGRALGWVGVDLLLQPDGQWVVIEVNPRLTTSVIGLSKASTVNLAQRMLDAFKGKECPRLLQSQWSEVEFSPTGV